MIFQLATPQDLSQLKDMYRRIMAYLDEINMQIWDEYYPCELLDGDVEKQRLYIMAQEDTPVAAFALCLSSAGENHVVWENSDASALYLERLGVDTLHMRNGLASQMLQKAVEVTRERGREYLRLFAAARLSQVLCKPLMWCRIEAAHWRFYYGKKQAHSGRNSPAREDSRIAPDSKYRQYGCYPELVQRSDFRVYGEQLGSGVGR